MHHNFVLLMFHLHLARMVPINRQLVHCWKRPITQQLLACHQMKIDRIACSANICSSAVSAKIAKERLEYFISKPQEQRHCQLSAGKRDEQKNWVFPCSLSNDDDCHHWHCSHEFVDRTGRLAPVAVFPIFSFSLFTIANIVVSLCLRPCCSPNSGLIHPQCFHLGIYI